MYNVLSHPLLHAARPFLILALTGLVNFPTYAQEPVITLGPPPWHLRPNVRWGLQAIVAEYNAAHPERAVVVTAGLESFDANTIGADVLGDVMFIPGAEYGRQSDLAILVARGLCCDLTERSEETEFAKEDFYENLWEAVSIDNKVWAIPLLVRSWGVAVDSTRIDCDWYGRATQTWRGFLDSQADMLRDINGDGMQDVSAIECKMSLYTLWQCVFLDSGGDPSDMNSFTAESVAWIKASEYVNALVQANRLLVRAPQGPNLVSIGSASSIQFVHDDRGNRTSFQDRRNNSIDWRLFPLPGGGPIPPLDTTVVAIKRSTPEREAAAWHFVAWLTSAPVMARLMPKYNMTPLRRTVVEESHNEDWLFFGSQIERMRFQRPASSPNEQATGLRRELDALTTGNN